MDQDAVHIKPEDQVVCLSSLGMHASAEPLTPWNSYLFAQEWFEDAIREARIGGDHHSRRREIVFAVYCAESFLLEWVRDDVLNRDFGSLPKYFPFNDLQGIPKRWKEIIRAVHSDGLVPGVPDFA